MGIIDDIKQKTDIVQIISEYTKLQKSGRNYKALCPFHAEKNPSFFVFPERQSWHCFGACGTGGDVFSFIMKREGLDFGQALRLLASKTGISLTTTLGHKKQTESKEKERLFEINEAAAEYYHHVLLDAASGEIASKYLKKREIVSETIKKFQLGYSPEGWENLKNYLKDRGYKETEILAAGLLVEKEEGTNYDRFRNRLIFPIKNVQGKVLGFGARALDESLPKYINSPQTAIFDKSSILYGIDRAKTAIRQNDLAIITEGYMDVITAHQYGWENVVASMGTAITDKQLAILKSLTTNLILALDADIAGVEAITRSGEVIDKALNVPALFYGWVKYEDARNAEVKIAVLPYGKDPDEVIKEDISLWQRLITNAKPMVDFIFEAVTNKVDLTSARDKTSVIDKLLPLLSEMKDPLRQAHYVERLARLLNVEQRVLADTLRKYKIDEQKKTRDKHLNYPKLLPLNSYTSSPLEQFFLALLLQHPELKSKTVELSSDCFECSENRILFQKWQESDNIPSLKENLDSVLYEYLDSLLAKTLPPTLRENDTALYETFNDCIVRLQEKRLRNLEIKKQELLAIEAELGGVEAQLARLEEQGIEITKQLKEIFIKQNYRRQRLARSNMQ